MGISRSTDPPMLLDVENGANFAAAEGVAESPMRQVAQVPVDVRTPRRRPKRAYPFSSLGDHLYRALTTYRQRVSYPKIKRVYRKRLSF